MFELFSEHFKDFLTVLAYKLSFKVHSCYLQVFLRQLFLALFCLATVFVDWPKHDRSLIAFSSFCFDVQKVSKNIPKNNVKSNLTTIVSMHVYLPTSKILYKI